MSIEYVQLVNDCLRKTDIFLKRAQDHFDNKVKTGEIFTFEDEIEYLEGNTAEGVNMKQSQKILKDYRDKHLSNLKK